MKFNKLILFSFFVGLFLISFVSATNSYVSFDRDRNGELTDEDISAFTAGAVSGAIEFESVLYVIDKAGKDGKIECANGNESCLTIPLYTRDAKTAQARSFYLMNMFGVSDSSSRDNLQSSLTGNVVTGNAVDQNGYVIPPPSGNAICPNGKCESGEDSNTCPLDCPVAGGNPNVEVTPKPGRGGTGGACKNLNNCIAPKGYKYVNPIVCVSCGTLVLDGGQCLIYPSCPAPPYGKHYEKDPNNPCGCGILVDDKKVNVCKSMTACALPPPDSGCVQEPLPNNCGCKLVCQSNTGPLPIISIISGGSTGGVSFTSPTGATVNVGINPVKVNQGFGGTIGPGYGFGFGGSGWNAGIPVGSGSSTGSGSGGQVNTGGGAVSGGQAGGNMLCTINPNDPRCKPCSNVECPPIAEKPGFICIRTRELFVTDNFGNTCQTSCGITQCIPDGSGKCIKDSDCPSGNICDFTATTQGLPGSQFGVCKPSPGRDVCGDGKCSADENKDVCPRQIINGPNSCKKACPADCGVTIQPVCGNNKCESGEKDNCPNCVGIRCPLAPVCLGKGTCPGDCPVTPPAPTGNCESNSDCLAGSTCQNIKWDPVNIPGATPRGTCKLATNTCGNNRCDAGEASDYGGAGCNLATGVGCYYVPLTRGNCIGDCPGTELGVNADTKVCGSDGKTYWDYLDAQGNGIRTYSIGKCSTISNTNEVCDPAVQCSNEGGSYNSGSEICTFSGSSIIFNKEDLCPSDATGAGGVTSGGYTWEGYSADNPTSCNNDVKACDPSVTGGVSGAFVVRNPMFGCEFNVCPVWANVPPVETFSAENSCYMSKPITCSDGSSVVQKGYISTETNSFMPMPPGICPGSTSCPLASGLRTTEIDGVCYNSRNELVNCDDKNPAKPVLTGGRCINPITAEILAMSNCNSPITFVPSCNPAKICSDKGGIWANDGTGVIVCSLPGIYTKSFSAQEVCSGILG